MIDIQSIVTNRVITFSSCRVRSIGTYPARNLNKNRIWGNGEEFVLRRYLPWIDKSLYFFENNVCFICVFAFFVVPLHLILKEDKFDCLRPL